MITSSNMPTLQEENIRSGIKIADVVGKFEGFSPCTSDWQINCIASTKLPATQARLIAGRCLIPKK